MCAWNFNWMNDIRLVVRKRTELASARIDDAVLMVKLSVNKLALEKLEDSLVPYLLNLLYLFLLVAASPWLLWSAVRKGKYREGYAEKVFGLVPRRTSTKKCFWLHAVSVGEVSLLAPLLRMIEHERPDWECVISTTTRAGMALAKKKYAGHTVFYCPLDFTWAVDAAMRRIRPDVLVLAELELWPNFVWAARRHGCADRDGKRPLERAQFSRLPTHSWVRLANAVASRRCGSSG